MGSSDRKTQHALTSGPVSLARVQASAGPFNGNNRFVFESDQVPATERMDMTCKLAGQLLGGFHLLPTNDPGFRAGMWALRTGDVVFGGGYLTSATFHLGSAPNTPSYQTPRHQNEEGIFWIYRR